MVFIDKNNFLNVTYVYISFFFYRIPTDDEKNYNDIGFRYISRCSNVFVRRHSTFGIGHSLQEILHVLNFMDMDVYNVQCKINLSRHNVNVIVKYVLAPTVL
jgi:hypothetical protein